MTRIPTLYALDRSIDAMNERRAALTRAQEQLSTGKRINSPSDDPLASAQAERTRAQLARMQIERRMMDFARGMLSQADSTMGQVGETLQFVREQLLAAGNGTLAPADRAMIAQQLAGMREELLALANQRDGSGAYLFGGQGSALPPFRADGTLATQVQAGEQQTGVERAFTTSHDGRSIFVGTGAGQNVFAVLDTAISLLNDPAASGSTLASGLQAAIAGVDAAHERRMRVHIGMVNAQWMIRQAQAWGVDTVDGNCAAITGLEEMLRRFTKVLEQPSIFAPAASR